jgi:hypothetical protein
MQNRYSLTHGFLPLLFRLGYQSTVTTHHPRCQNTGTVSHTLHQVSMPLLMNAVLLFQIVVKGQTYMDQRNRIPELLVFILESRVT